MEVADTSKSDDDIVTTIFTRQHAERRGGGAGCKDVVVSIIVFALCDILSCPKKVMPKEERCMKRDSRCKRLQKREY